MQFVNEMPGKADNCFVTVTTAYALKKKVTIIVGYYCIFFQAEYIRNTLRLSWSERTIDDFSKDLANDQLSFA